MEECIREYIHKIALGNDFLNKTQKLLTKKAKLNYIKISVSFPQGHHKENKRQAIYWGKYLCHMLPTKA